MEMSLEHKERVALEYKQLEERHIKLRQFMETDFFSQLDRRNRFLLVKQELAMNLYRDILFARIEENNIFIA